MDSWKERLPDFIKGNERDDIWNVDETGVFLAGFTRSWLWATGETMLWRQEEQEAGNTGLCYCFRQEGETSFYMEIGNTTVLSLFYQLITLHRRKHG